MKNTTDHTRRAILGAVAIGLPAAIAGAYAASPAIDATAWDKAMAALEAALAAEPAYESGTYEVLKEQWNAAGRPGAGMLHDRLMESVEHSNALGEAVADAQTELMLIPAPHGAALLWKLDHIMEDSGDGSSAGWSLSYTEQMMADARRFLRGEG